MTDEQLKRANEIQDKLLKLNILKKELEKRIRITIHFDDFKDLREPFIDIVEGNTAKLKEEYEKL